MRFVKSNRLYYYHSTLYKNEGSIEKNIGDSVFVSKAGVNECFSNHRGGIMTIRFAHYHNLE